MQDERFCFSQKNIVYIKFIYCYSECELQTFSTVLKYDNYEFYLFIHYVYNLSFYPQLQFILNQCRVKKQHYAPKTIETCPKV